jgi:predicted DNA-binding transcriptional regulator YafY
MRRADRLFQIIELLRRHGVLTATDIAEKLEVSVRTIYRDMDDISASGVPLRAEAGIGYALEKGYDLPPLMFTQGELESLEVAARLLASIADKELQAGAEAALAKIRAVLPHTLRNREDLAVFAPDFVLGPRMRAAMPALRQALREQRKISLHYKKENGEESRRVLRPLGLIYWGRVWTLVAWCEWRDDFRHFCLDRMEQWDLLDLRFQAEPGKTLEDFMQRHRNREAAAAR